MLSPFPLLQSLLLCAAGTRSEDADFQQGLWRGLQPTGAFLWHGSVTTLQMANCLWFENSKNPRRIERRSQETSSVRKATGNSRIDRFVGFATRLLKELGTCGNQAKVCKINILRHITHMKEAKNSLEPHNRQAKLGMLMIFWKWEVTATSNLSEKNCELWILNKPRKRLINNLSSF